MSRATKKSPARSAANGKQQRRLWLMYPPRLIQRPIIWELGQKFPLVTNLRQVSVTDEIGIVCLELEGERTQIKAAIKWLEKQGIRLEPVEINVIES
jgi:L-aspartate semialdehyde sulfurtransferase ferredoxin